MGRGQAAARCGRDGGTIGTRAGWRLRSRSDRVCWFRWGWLCGSCGGLWSTRLAEFRQGIYGWEETLTTTEPAQNETVPDIGASIIRTLVPLLVGVLVALGSRYLAVELPVDALEEVVTVVVAGVYYAVARVLEEWVSPVWGRVLLGLGIGGTPRYTQQ